MERLDSTHSAQHGSLSKTISSLDDVARAQWAVSSFDHTQVEPVLKKALTDGVCVI